MPPLVFIHVIAGYLGLLTGFTVMVMPKKGNRLHKKLGILYFILMMTATLLAILLSILHPGRMFLFFIGVFTFHSLLGGFLMIAKRYKKLKWVLIPLSIIGFANGGFMIYTQSIVLVIFGSLQLLLAFADMKMFFTKELHPLQIVKAHAGKMAGSFTAATTAFGVNVVFTGGDWWHWLLPTLIITPVSTWWGIQLDRKRKALLAKTENN